MAEQRIPLFKKKGSKNTEIRQAEQGEHKAEWAKKDGYRYTKKGRYTLSEMRARSTGHFFDKDTMKFFKGDSYGTRYDKATGINYLYSYRLGKQSLGEAWWIFNPETGHFHAVSKDNVPDRIRNK